MGIKHKLVILGITGSIGTQTVAIAKKLGYSIVGCSFHSNVKLGKQLVKQNKIKYSCCTTNDANGNCASYDELIKKAKPDLVVNAIIGFAGLKGTLATIHNKVNLALANKESIVTAGWYILDYAKKHNINVIPIDSEHTSLYKLLLDYGTEDVNELFITCSGGKYWNTPKSKLKNVKYAQAICHDNWLMGNKITIDSNTLLNKCFEVVEAYYYFQTKRINVLLDRTSIIHAAIMLNDGQFIYSNSKPIMTTPIAQVLSGFEYVIPKQDQAEPINDVLVKINDVKPISWAYDIINDKTRSLGILINAANETAIQLFKNNMLRFDQIVDFVQNSIKRIKLRPIKTIDEIYSFDTLVRLNSIKYWK